MTFIKVESEDMKIEEDFKYEDTEERTEMMFIKEESEDVKIEEAFRVKHEDTEEQTGWFSFSKSFSSHSVSCISLSVCYLSHNRINDM